MKYIYTLLLALFFINMYSQSIEFTNQRGRLILGTQKARTASISFGDLDGDIFHRLILRIELLKDIWIEATFIH